ncbi:MAG: toll/interleukin-1 receptor domain-containing protein [Bryobacteraceae bacterium]
MGEIFLSYSRQDEEFAALLIKGLEARNLHVWVDRENIQGGAEWRAAISRAIASCEAFLVVLSPQCIKSQNIVKELSIAESRQRHIIPLMYQPCEIPPGMEYQLAGLQWIDFSELEFETALGRLVSAVGAENEPKEPPPTPPPAPPTQPRKVVAAKRKPPKPQRDLAETLEEALRTTPEQRFTKNLYGHWNVRIEIPYAGAVGQMTLELRPNGSFSGQVAAPAGLSQVTGTWRVTSGQQLEMTGQQTMGWNSAPYYAAIRFLLTAGNLMSGASAAGETVTFTKVA